MFKMLSDSLYIRSMRKQVRNAETKNYCWKIKNNASMLNHEIWITLKLKELLENITNA